MSKTTFHAVILAVAAAIGGAAYTGSAVAAESVSAAAAKPLDAANKAIRANRIDEALARLKDVGAVSGKTAYDTYVMNQLLAYANIKKNNPAEAAAAMEAQLASSFPTAAERTQLNKQLLGIYFNLKNYAKVTELGQGLISSGAADSTTYNVLAQAYERQGKLPDAVKLIRTRVNGAVSKGARPTENELLLLLDLQRRSKDSAGEADTFEKLVTYYPKGDYWQNIIPALLRTPGNSDLVTLNIYRLMTSTGTLSRGDDYTEMAQLAIEMGSPAEAVDVLQKGLAANVFKEQREKDRTNRLIEAAKKQAATVQSGLAKTEADAKAAATGDLELQVARAYYGMGQYDKAAEAASRSVQKGGASVAEAQLLLGIAQLRQKKSADAVKSFNGVKSTDDKFKRVANLWALHARG